jgi:hypothetical protein
MILVTSALYAASGSIAIILRDLDRRMIQVKRDHHARLPVDHGMPNTHYDLLHVLPQSA